MDVGASRGVLRMLDQVEDPRVNRTKRHSLTDMLFVTICAVLSGADGWTEVELFGETKLDWLRRFVPLANGTPSHDTFGRVFARLDPVQLERCYLQWMSALAEATEGRLIAIDGKTIRRSFDKAGGKAAIHMVSAWCEANHLVLGQVATQEKSNEITAIPDLLGMLDVRRAVVTIDAMGCDRPRHCWRTVPASRGNQRRPWPDRNAANLDDRLDGLVSGTRGVGGPEKLRVRGERSPHRRSLLHGTALLHQ